MGRLTTLHINIIGLVTAIILSLILFFALIKPKQDDIAKTQGEIDSTESSGGTDAKVQEGESTLKKEKVNTQNINAQWAVDEQYYMPKLNFGSNLLTLYEFKGYGNMGFKDLPTYWGTWVTKWYDDQNRQGIARAPGTFFPIDAFPADPNQIAALTSITFPKPADTWKVQVECKTFNEAMNHLRRFNKMQGHGVPVVDKVALSGQSPHLLMNYEMAPYIIPSTAPPQKDSRIGGEVSVGAGGGGGGGMGGKAGMMMPGMGK